MLGWFNTGLSIVTLTTSFTGERKKMNGINLVALARGMELATTVVAACKFS